VPIGGWRSYSASLIAYNDLHSLDSRAALLKHPDAEAALAAIKQDLAGHAEGLLHDDAAMLLLRYRRR
jgi:hypothetical protein